MSRKKKRSVPVAPPKQEKNLIAKETDWAESNRKDYQDLPALEGSVGRE